MSHIHFIGAGQMTEAILRCRLKTRRIKPGSGQLIGY
jgi:pyrroline-5-carboxylate reductase